MLMRSVRFPEGNSAMSTYTLPRLAGGALVTGSVLTVLGFALTDLQNGTPTPATVRSPAFLGGSLLVYAGAVLVLLGLPGLLNRQFDRSRKLTLIGTVGFALVTIIDSISNTFANITLFPMLIDNPATRAEATGSPPAIMGVFFIAGAIAGLAGTVTLGISLLRARVFPRWTAIVLFVAAAAFPVGGALENLPPILAGVAMIGIGARLLAERPEPASHPAGVAAPAAA
jgi:hypothetical protein